MGTQVSEDHICQESGYSVHGDFDILPFAALPNAVMLYAIRTQIAVKHSLKARAESAQCWIDRILRTGLHYLRTEDRHV